MNKAEILELAKVIEQELGVQEMVLADPLTLRRLHAERIARAALSWFREYLGREETVDRAAAAIVKQGDGCEWASMSDSAKDCERNRPRRPVRRYWGRYWRWAWVRIANCFA